MLRIVRGVVIGASMVLASGVITFSSGAITPLASSGAAVHVQSADQRAKAAEAKAALLKYLKNSRPTAKLIRRSGLRPSQTNLQAAASLYSYNWSGYAGSSSTKQAFSAVYGGWVVPKLFCSATEQRLASDWVGLDGFSTSTVEQAGTLGWCFQGTPYYYTWWEMYPASTTTVGITVNPGDRITAKVTRSGTSYTLAVTDATTTGNSFSVTQSCAASTCLDESAEWIHERPSFSIGVAPLAPTYSWGLYGGNQVSGGVTGTIAGAPNVTSLTMVDATDTYNLATPDALATSGKGFTLHYQNSY